MHDCPRFLQRHGNYDSLSNVWFSMFLCTDIMLPFTCSFQPHPCKEVVCAWQEFSSSMDHGYILMYERQRPGERADADADADASGGGSGDSEMLAAPSPPGSLA